jgi:hypothetical protein
MQKTLLYISIFISFQCALSAQDLANLDRKNGFKDLKLGAGFDKVKTKFDSAGKTENGYLIYNSKEYKSIYKNKIHEIRILTEFTTFEEVKTVLMEAFGEPKDKPCELLEVEQGKRTDCAWKAENVLLWCTAIEFKDYQKTIIGYKAYKLAENMKKELTKKAVGDL